MNDTPYETFSGHYLTVLVYVENLIPPYLSSFGRP